MKSIRLALVAVAFFACTDTDPGRRQGTAPAAGDRVVPGVVASIPDPLPPVAAIAFDGMSNRLQTCSEELVWRWESPRLSTLPFSPQQECE